VCVFVHHVVVRDKRAATIKVVCVHVCVCVPVRIRVGIYTCVCVPRCSAGQAREAHTG